MIETRKEDTNTQATQGETKRKRETKMKDTNDTRTEISGENCALFLSWRKMCEGHGIKLRLQNKNCSSLNEF